MLLISKRQKDRLHAFCLCIYFMFKLTYCQSEGYFQCPTPTRARTPTPPPLTPSPESVEKASNPIALRYWNQCLEKNSEGRTPTPPTPPAPPSKPEVVRVLSTAGAGVRRAQEVGEARGNISRFITIDQVRRRDGEHGAVQVELSSNIREVSQCHRREHFIYKDHNRWVVLRIFAITKLSFS